ncbi:MAG: hypothetical protein HC817_07005 [Saprospiraceae bacterium]|nr:hypothetical protein [Saprospiraceae bacterium]
MKRTQWILLGILTALALLTGVFYVKNNQKTSLDGYDYNFAVADTSIIGKIFYRKSSRWRSYTDAGGQKLAC